MATSKGPLNYTTTIDATKSAAECIGRLAAHGASAIGITYADRKPTGITFRIVTVHGERQFSLPVNVTGTQKALEAAWRAGRIPNRYRDRDQAERVATWEPDHFTDRHPLATRAAELCDTREHTMRRRIGRVACGHCWETVIRADERTAAILLARPLAGDEWLAADAPLSAPREWHRELGEGAS